VRKRALLVLTAICAFALVTMGADSCSDTGSSGDDKSSDSGSSTSESSPKKSANCGTKATDDCTPHVSLKKQIRVDAIYWRVLSAKTASSLGDSSIGTGENADGVFVVAKVKARSDKNESATLTDDAFKLTYKGGPEYSVDNEGSTAALLSSGSDSAEEPFFLRDIQPDTTTSGVLVFDIPKSALNKKLELRFNELGFGSTHGYIRLPHLSQ
jgi:hypothetical protein